MAQYSVISFLSDMGTSDEAVGVCKSVMYQQAPHVTILDITHEVTPFDVRAGALALTRAIQFLPNGVIVAAVDPGIPRDQRYIAVEMETGVLIGPDNGILAPAVQLLGNPKRAHELTNPDFRIGAPGGIFSARDILAPAAGVIASGTDLKELGNLIPFEELVPGMLHLSRHDEGGAFLGEVWSIDRFGNVQLNITPEELQSQRVSVGDTVIIRIDDRDFMALCVETYADLSVSQFGIIVDSTGMVSVVKNLDSAARELNVKEGKAVAILPSGTTLTGKDKTVQDLIGTPEQIQQHAQQDAMASIPATYIAPDLGAPTGDPQFVQPAVPPTVQPAAEPGAVSASTDSFGSMAPTEPVYAQQETQFESVYGQPVAPPTVQPPVEQQAAPVPTGLPVQPPVEPQPQEWQAPAGFAQTDLPTQSDADFAVPSSQVPAAPIVENDQQATQTHVQPQDEQPQREQSLSDILNASSMPSTFAQGQQGANDFAQPDPLADIYSPPIQQPVQEPVQPPVESQPTPQPPVEQQVTQPTEQPQANPYIQGFGAPMPAPQAQERVQPPVENASQPVPDQAPAQQPAQTPAQPGMPGSLPENVFDLFKSDQDESDENQQ